MLVNCALHPERFDGVLEHVLRIDRVLRQPMGHLLLVGEAGAGKTVLSRFVSWMNGLAIFQASGTTLSPVWLIDFLVRLCNSPKNKTTDQPISQVNVRLY